MHRAIVRIAFAAICWGIAAPSVHAWQESGSVAPPALPEESQGAPNSEAPPVRPRRNDSPTADSAQGYLLRYIFAPNQFAHYDVAHKMTITMQKGEVSQTAVNEAKTRKHYRVTTTDDQGNGVLELTIDHVKMTAQFASEPPVVFDSDSELPPPKQFLDIKETIGTSQNHLRFKSNGRLISATQLQQGVRQQQIEPQPEKSIDAPTAESDMNFLVEFPEKPVRVGETWKDEMSVRVKVSGEFHPMVKLQRRYTLERVEGDLATIGMQMSVLTPVNDPTIRGQLIQRTPSGTIVFNMKTGLIVSRTTSLDKVEIGVAGDNSSMRAVSECTERLLTPAEVAQRNVDK